MPRSCIPCHICDLSIVSFRKLGMECLYGMVHSQPRFLRGWRYMKTCFFACVLLIVFASYASLSTVYSLARLSWTLDIVHALITSFPPPPFPITLSPLLHSSAKNVKATHAYLACHSQYRQSIGRLICRNNKIQTMWYL